MFATDGARLRPEMAPEMAKLLTSRISFSASITTLTYLTVNRPKPCGPRILTSDVPSGTELGDILICWGTALAPGWGQFLHPLLVGSLKLRHDVTATWNAWSLLVMCMRRTMERQVGMPVVTTGWTLEDGSAFRMYYLAAQKTVYHTFLASCFHFASMTPNLTITLHHST